MAVVSGSDPQVHTIKADAVSRLQVAEITFYVSGTYAQADNGILTGVAALIAASRRNGKTATLVAAMPSQAASKKSDATTIMGLKTVAVASADVTFEITDGDMSTELGNGAVPAQSRPFGILVAFTEA